MLGGCGGSQYVGIGAGEKLLVFVDHPRLHATDWSRRRLLRRRKILNGPGLEDGAQSINKRDMKIRILILLSGALLTAATIVAFHGDLSARVPRHLNKLAPPVTECGYWGDMSEGMSCR